MPNHSGNIYQSARLAAGITQERAAGLLNMGVRTLADYETDNRLPPDDVVSNMILTYGFVPLGAQHLRHKSDLGRQLIPDLRVCSLLEAAARMLRSIDRIRADGVIDQLLDISLDNIVDPTELEDYEHLMENVQDLIQVAMELHQAGDAAKVKGGQRGKT